MKPETAAFLQQAKQSLADSVKLAEIGVFRIAVREAYLAAFHAAQAVIFEEAGKVAKTHSGVRSEFARFAERYGNRTTSATTFLANGYRWKEAADYDPSSGIDFDAALANSATTGAARVVEAIEGVLGNADPTSDKD